jgi:hypothetical protein
MEESRQQARGDEIRGARKPHRLPVILTVGTVWLSLIVTGMAMILRHANTPGESAVKPANWPADSQITLDANRLTLVMFAHPHCPCTRASLGELEQLMSDRPGTIAAQVWFIEPAGMTEDWTDTDIWRQAAAIPGVTVHVDAAGTEARRFHADTSGQTLLYDNKGHLQFGGGITLSRGHAGDNPGLSALEALAGRLPADVSETPVFGCALFEPNCAAGQTNLCKP